MQNIRIASVLLLLLCFRATFSPVSAQQRIADNNIIFWAGSFNTIYISDRTSVWLEYQMRRSDFMKSWQVSLPRIGLQYNLNSGASIMGGYAYITLYPYGDYPAGKYSIPEHRVFEQISWNESIGRLSLNHRIRLEQRFLGKVDQKAPEYTLNDWTYLNRVRYQLKAVLPLNNKKMSDHTFYAGMFDELMIGFGPNVNQNIFDQNRFGIIAGYQLNSSFKFEAGYLNQTLQQGGLVNGKEVIQYNNGALLNCFLTLGNTKVAAKSSKEEG